MPLAIALLAAAASAAAGQTATTPPQTPAQAVAASRVTCESRAGERQHCAADTTKGVILLRSIGTAPCLLGRSWGYDDRGIWVSDGCSAEFIAGLAVPPEPVRTRPLEHVPNVGFLLYDGEKGQIYFRLFSYARYLNQRNIDASYDDSFGNTKAVPQRQDMQLQKFFAPFTGWYLTPKFRYYLYVWSSNPSQGDPAQVVGAGNLSYTFNRFVSLGAGITSLPTVRSTEGQFPYWLGVDDRLVADEFFRGSYTTGFWLKGEASTRLKYFVMFANNLSTLGVSAAQLDNRFDTQSYSVQWLPTTGEFGLYGTFGDYDHHERVATRLGLHYSRSREEEQSQPGTEAIENSQIRLSDGNNVFTANLFGQGITVNEVIYQMVSVDAGIKHRGRAIEAEFYWRRLGGFTGVNTAGLPVLHDTGYQLQASAMVVRETLQLYLSGSQIFGGHGDPWEVRAGENWYFLRTRGLRVNGELIYVRRSPVGYTAYPMPVGANGFILHLNLEMNF
jgi:hypothetical protein